MSKPVLYYNPLSPPARAVVMTALENKIDLEMNEIDFLKGEHLSDFYTKINPKQTIPFLVDGDMTICDSQAICMYLIEKYAKNDILYPKNNFKLRTIINDRMFFNASFLFPRGFSIFFPVIMKGEGEIQNDKIDQIQRCYKILDGYVAKNKWMACNEHMTIADLAIFAWMESMVQVFSIDKYPKLLAWLTEMRKLSYYQEANKKGADFHIKIFKQALDKNKK